MDGSSNVNGYGAAGIVLISLEEHTIEYGLCFKFYLPNNIVEYKTLWANLNPGKSLTVNSLQVHDGS